MFRGRDHRVEAQPPGDRLDIEAVRGGGEDEAIAIGPVLREKGLLFTGIDVIDGWLTEINVTSPTGIQELERFDGINAAALLWDAIDRKLAGRA